MEDHFKSQWRRENEEKPWRQMAGNSSPVRRSYLSCHARVRERTSERTQSASLNTYTGTASDDDDDDALTQDTSHDKTVYLKQEQSHLAN